MTNPPFDNAGKVTSATVSAPALVKPGPAPPTAPVTTDPEAYVDAAVGAGEIPFAEAIPKHDNIDDVALPEGYQARWEGWAEAYLWRTTRHPTSREIEGPVEKRNIDTDLKIWIRRESETRLENHVEWIIPRRGGEWGWDHPVDGAVIGVAEWILGGLLAAGAAYLLSSTKDTEVMEYQDVKLKHDPVPQYEVRTAVPTGEIPRGDDPHEWTHRVDITNRDYDVIESGAELTGEWGTNIRGTPPVEIKGGGGEDLYQRSHTHPGDFSSLHP